MNKIDQLINFESEGADHKSIELYKILLDEEQDLNFYRVKILDHFKATSKEIDELKSKVKQSKHKHLLTPVRPPSKHKRANSVLRTMKNSPNRLEASLDLPEINNYK